MSWKIWKRSEPAAAPAPDRRSELNTLLAEIRVAGDEASPGQLVRAGSLAFSLGDDAAGSRLLGCAIDRYITLGKYEPAAAVCRTLLRHAPETVRAHCTLAFLAAGSGMAADAARALVSYLEAVRRSGTRSLAVPRLTLLGTVVADPELRACIADALEEFGAAERDVAEVREGPAAPAHPEARWRQIRRAITKPPEQLWRDGWTGA